MGQQTTLVWAEGFREYYRTGRSSLLRALLAAHPPSDGTTVDEALGHVLDIMDGAGFRPAMGRMPNDH